VYGRVVFMAYVFACGLGVHGKRAGWGPVMGLIPTHDVAQACKQVAFVSA
jgi:hypothetical protein